MIQRWRYVAASVAGTSHEKTSLPCQDSFGHLVVPNPGDEEVLVLVASDGAGSAKRAEAGAALACASTLELVQDYFGSGGCISGIDRTIAASWIATIKGRLATAALAEGDEVRDFACTLLVAVIGPADAAFIQLGDGAIVVSSEGEGSWAFVFWPQHGEFANTTNFLVDQEAERLFEFDSSSGVIRDVAVFTDGIENLVLNKREKIVHAPFFESVFPSVRALTSEGLDRGLSKALMAYLASSAFNEKTDDDKTLLLASRRHRALQAPETS